MGHPYTRALIIALLLVFTASDAGALSSRSGPVPNHSEPKSSEAKAPKASELVRIPLLHRDELDVYGRVRIGTQTLDVVFDTGSSETWVSTSTSPNHDSPSATSCQSDEQFTIKYGGGFVAGRTVRRAIRFIASAPHYGLTVPAIWMGDVDQDLVALDEIRADGVVGLGMEALQQQWASLSITTEAASSGTGERTIDTSQRPVLLELLAKGGPSPLLFSIFIAPDPHREEHPHSQLVFGGVDPDLVSPNSTWHDFPVVPYTHNGADGYGFWALRLCSISLGNQMLLPGREERSEQSTSVVVLDSGSSLILLPPQAFLLVESTLSQEIGSRFSCARRDHSAFESFECVCRRCSAQEFPDLTITLISSAGQRQALVLHGADYVWCGRRRSSECSLLLDVDASGSDDRVVLGAVFLRVFYSAFDYSNKRIALAKPIRHDSRLLPMRSTFRWGSVVGALAVIGGSILSLFLVST